MIATELHVQRRFAAPPERVFAAWTEPEVLRRWWAAGPDWSCTSVETDVRVGGRYRLAMTGPGTGEHVVGGEYLEVQPPHRLVYTWAWEGADAAGGGPPTTLVAVEFRPEAGGGTTVVVTHTGFPGPAERDQHATGWAACLANLDVRVLRTEVAP
ncbi:MAG: SRPBCC family protein [Pseudonocardia sp.]